QERLDVNGNTRVRGNALVRDSITADTGSITATVGNIVSTVANIVAGNNVIAGMDVTSGRNVSARSDVTADRDVRGTRDVAAGNNVTAGNEITATNNIRAGKSVYAGEHFYGKHFFYSDVPSSGPGGGTGNSTVTAICPQGKVLQSINSGAPVCVPGAVPTAAFTCEGGKFVSGFDNEGRPLCSDPFSGPNGAVQTFNCPGKGTNGVPAEDHQSGYTSPTFNDNWCAYTMIVVADACIEQGVPGRETPLENLPAPYGNMDLNSFLNTCGKRYCVKKGYQDGRVVEYGPSGQLANGSYYDVTQTLPHLTYEERRIEFSRRPLEIKCTKI
ncbi:MAG: hypothetical protein DI626_01120, partial [Micavibrio aeruginosavorus]